MSVLRSSAILRWLVYAIAILTLSVPANAAWIDAPAAAASGVIAADEGMNHPGMVPGVGSEDGSEPVDAAAEDEPAVPWVNFALLAFAVVGLWLFIDRRWYRLRRAPQRPIAFSVPGGILMFVAGAILLPQIGVMVASHAFAIDTEQPLGLREMSLLQIGRNAGEAVIVVLFFVLVMQARRSRPDPRYRVPSSILFGCGALILFWLFVLTLVWLITLAQYHLLQWKPHPIAHELLVRLLEEERTVWYFFMVLNALLIAPIFEEVIYRGFLQELLGRLNMPRWWAIIGASAIFTMMHYAAAPSPEARLPMLASLFVLSLGFGWAYEKTGRLAAPITMHILFNAGNLTFALWAA